MICENCVFQGRPGEVDTLIHREGTYVCAVCAPQYVRKFEQEAAERAFMERVEYLLDRIDDWLEEIWRKE